VEPEDKDQFKQEAAAANEGASENASQRLSLKISVEDLSEPISSALKKIATPHREPTLRSFVKDYSSLLTPILTAVIAAIVGYFGYRFDDHISKDTLDRITTEFVQGGTDPNITAMKLAAYGEKALPAVKVALGAKEPRVRDGAVQIAAQMYFEETVDRKKLTRDLLKFYDNPVLRLGVLEWLSTVQSSPIPLPDCQQNDAFKKLQQTFGPTGEKCSDQDAAIAGAAANLLLAGLGNRRDFVAGMEQHCPKDFDGTHKTLEEILKK